MTEREQAQAAHRAAGRTIEEYPDGSWAALPTAEEETVTAAGCQCPRPQPADGYCDLCGYRIGGTSCPTPREAHEIFVSSDGTVHDHE